VDRGAGVSAEALKLVVHLGEASRIGGRLASDVLMDMCAAAKVASAVLLRAAEGYGGHHRLRTDRLLSMSEDLPLVLVAVDRATRVVPLADEAARLLPSGLLVLERASLPGLQLDDDTFGAAGGGESKLTVYCARPDAEAVARRLRAAGLSGAIALAGVDGVVLGDRRRARVLSRNRGVPALVMGVGPRERVAAALPAVRATTGPHVATLERVSIVRRDGAAVGPLPVVPPEDDAGLGRWQRLIAVGGEQEGPGGRPFHVGLIRDLRSAGAPGATALRGTWAQTADGARHADRLLAIRRRGPVLVTLIARPAEMARLFPVVERATADAGLVTCELLPAVRVTPARGPARGGLRLARTGR
jgi:PII-like signaling protein